MAKTFRQMVSEAREQVDVLSPQDAQKKMQETPNVVVVDVREAEDLAATGVVPGAVNIPLGMLPLRADTELPESLRDPRLQDRSTPVITTCGGGGQAALAAKTLKDMGFTNVSMIDGGTRGWKEAGLPTE
ncbi:MAG TPA: rhodanese-like domain-containing protein [Chloroflexota bacterium]|jgi:rhodanese-related sulfurtransferase|nr:rhodanese-like domain-containing protein [Chloroflexota bacterium]